MLGGYVVGATWRSPVTQRDVVAGEVPDPQATGTGIGMPTDRDVAEAFSRHRFEDTYASLAQDVEWNQVGEEVLRGRAAVIDACDESAEELADVATTFTRFRVIETPGCVVVDSEAEYAAENEVSTVASCDIYDFTDGRLSAITSYAIELEEG
jgi:hypothetical protein